MMYGYLNARYLSRVSHEELLLKILACLSICMLLSACASYKSYSVEFQDAPVRIAEPPTLESTPILESDEFNLYRGSADPQVLFVIPTHLYLTESYARRYQAVGFERNDGEHLFFIAQLSPDPEILLRAEKHVVSNGIQFRDLRFYPIDAFLIRPATDPREPQSISVTAISGRPSPSAPFSASVIIQVRGRENIISFKKLLELDMGYLLFAYCDIFTGSGDARGVKTVGVQMVLRKAYITNQTI